jgi:hypothetical protein
MNTKTRKRHRRMLDELQKLADKACDSDRLFFERKRDRSYRIRRSRRAEVLQNHLLSPGEFDSRLPPGLAWFVARCKREVRRIWFGRPPMSMDFNDMLMPFRSGSPSIDPGPRQGSGIGRGHVNCCRWIH